MTTKGSFKRQLSHKKYNSLSRGFFSVVLGGTLLLTIGNIYRTVNSFKQQQLISLPSEAFASQKYQPIQFGDTKNLAQHDFDQIDILANQLSYSGSSVTELADLLAQNAPTEADKARIIYAWITQHISYDVAAFHDALDNNHYPDVNPATVLRDRTTICSGYSNLYQALADAMNLEAATVIGYAKGATPANDLRFQDTNHAWNSVRIDGAWYLLDATFGAGSVQNDQFAFEYNPYYFATSPQQFLNNHYPEDRGWQLLAQASTRAEFDNLPNISSRFYRLGLATISHGNYQITAANRVDIKLKAPQDVVAIAELKQNNLELADNTVLANRQGENIIVSVAPPNTGIYDLTIFAKQKDDLEQYGEVIKYQIQATNSTAKLPKVYGHFYQHQASLIEPLSADLAPNWSTYFNLLVPEALDVQVIDLETKQWTPLNRYGANFSGHVEIKSGQTAVIANFPGDEQYWQLVEYQAGNALSE
jgi:transglutaminase/protease-like cytokinesis protein 3